MSSIVTGFRVFGFILVLSALGSANAHAFGPHRMTEKEHGQCNQLAKTGFREWKKPNLSKIPGLSAKEKTFAYELPLALIVYRHKTFFENTLDEKELAYHVEQARFAYDQCGIAVTVESVRFLDGPRFLNHLDRDGNSPDGSSDQEVCLIGPTRHPGVVNVYFVEDARASGEIAGGPSHAIRSGDFTGAAILADPNRRWNTIEGKPNFQREILLPHEVGHIVFDSSMPVEGLPANLMNHDAPTSLEVTQEQCYRAYQSPFVKTKAPAESLPQGQ
ncbi:MAG: hypothetical protein ACXWPM_08980 [Bdellovibrionota bacterium]